MNGEANGRDGPREIETDDDAACRGAGPAGPRRARRRVRARAVDGGGGAAQLNNEISGAGRVDDILKLVTGGVKLDFIHVANAMNKLVKVAKRGPGENPRGSWRAIG